MDLSVANAVITPAFESTKRILKFPKIETKNLYTSAVQEPVPKRRGNHSMSLNVSLVNSKEGKREKSLNHSFTNENRTPSDLKVGY